MSIADQVQGKKRRAAAIGLVAVPLTFLLLLALGQVAVPWAVIVGLLIYFRMLRTDKYIVWLRRFHRSEPTRLRFNMLLNRASPGLCVPITIQDSVFKTSYYSSGSRMLLVAPIVFGIGVFFYGLCAVTIAFGLAKLGVGDGLNINLGLLIGLIPVGLFGYAVKTQLAKRGHVSLAPHNATEEVESTLLRIAKRKLGFQGVMIIKCPDEVWQQVVSLCISRASTVLIDVSDLTGNVLWELRTSLEKHRPETLLLTFAVPKDAREELPSTVRAELEKAVNADVLSRLRIFYYPTEQPPPGPSRGRLYTNLSKKLATEIAACMENASA